ncbi:MAG TPA: STAS domain-containing protein [Actinomycetota bacterium]|jgi:anti-anti-sigma factor|nr:STAS domain-containing protein [Actinomycetota bacterium]
MSVSGDVDVATWAALSDVLRKAVDSRSEGKVVLDLTELSFIDGHGVAAPAGTTVRLHIRLPDGE